MHQLLAPPANGATTTTLTYSSRASWSAASLRPLHHRPGRPGCGRSPSGTTKTARQEVDDKGEPIEQAWAKIGTFYIRKSAFERGQRFPQTLRVTVSYD